MCHSILITGYGRSGTAFLANALNKSKQWSVFHEPRGNADDLGRKMKVDMRLEEESRETGRLRSTISVQLMKNKVDERLQLNSHSPSI